MLRRYKKWLVSFSLVAAGSAANCTHSSQQLIGAPSCTILGLQY